MSVTQYMIKEVDYYETDFDEDERLEGSIWSSIGNYCFIKQKATWKRGIYIDMFLPKGEDHSLKKGIGTARKSVTIYYT